MRSFILQALLSVFLVTVFLSCASGPNSNISAGGEGTQGPAPQQTPPPLPPPPATPDPYSEQTFEAVGELVDRLNNAIASRDFETWQGYLSQEYRDHFTDEDVLRELERAPVLRTAQIRLRSLEDYFQHVVVPSRQDAQLEELQVDSQQQITALSDVQGRRVVLYHLIWQEEEWKVAPF